MKDWEAKDSAQQGGGGATGIFGALSEEVPKGTSTGAAAAVPVTSIPAEPPVSDLGLGSGAELGFTHLLRTLSLHEPVGGPTPDTPRGSGAGSVPVFSSVAPGQPSAAASHPFDAPSHATVAPSQAPVTPGYPSAAAANAGGGTQMFEAVQPQWAASAIASSVVPAAASPGAQTQATRPVDTGIPAAPVGSAPAGGGFTQLFQALDNPAPARASEAVAAPTSSQLEAEPFAEAPFHPPTAVPVSAANAPPGGFTALFRSLDNEVSGAPPASATAPVVLPAAVAIAAPAAALAAQPSSPAPPAGGITQLLRAIDLGSLGSAKPSGQAATGHSAPAFPASPAAPAAPLSVETAAPVAAEMPPTLPAASVSLAPAGEVIPEPIQLTASTPMMSTMVPSAAPPSAAAEASSLTGMFAPAPFAVPAEAVAPAAAAPVPAQGVIPTSPPASSLTGMFSSVALPVAVPAPISPAAAPVAATASSPMAAAAAAGPGGESGGSFTQLFRSLDRSAEAASPPTNAASEQSQDSFTKFFSSASMQPAREASQADSFPPLPPSGGAARAEYGAGAGGFGEAHGWKEPRFSTPPPARPAAFPPSYSSPSYPEPQSRMPEPPAAGASGGGVGSGGLTQLLRTLDGPSSSPAPASPSRVESAFGSQPMPSRTDSVFDAPAAGSSGATTAFRLPQGLPTPAAPASPAGPGEFTRIIQASALRESARQGGGAAAAPAGAAPAAPAAASGFSASLSGMPSMPSAPVMPTMPSMSGGGGGGGFAAPPTPMMPAVPSIPNITLTAPSAAAPAASGGSKMLPILLIVAIVLLIAVLLAVVLLMKH